MDRERLFRFINERYIAKSELYSFLPLGANADEVWDEVLEKRRAKSIVLPLTNTDGYPYWYTLTDKMIVASENVVNELFEYENENRRKTMSSISNISEIFFTGYLEGAQISVQDAMSFLQSGEEPHDIEELMIINNRQAGSFAAENIHHQISESYLRTLERILTNGLDNGGGDFRVTDDIEIYSMQGESYSLPKASELYKCVEEITGFLADPNIHPMIKSAVAQAWVMVTRPFAEGNERLGRLLSEIILIRSGYTFFSEVSISAIIVQNGYGYFNAIANIIRIENGGDMTYFLEYYLLILSSAVDELRDRRKKKEEENRAAEIELAKKSLSPTDGNYISVSDSDRDKICDSDEAALSEIPDDEKITKIKLMEIINGDYSAHLIKSAKLFLTFLESGHHEITSSDLIQNLGVNQKKAYRIMRVFVDKKIIYFMTKRKCLHIYCFSFYESQQYQKEKAESLALNDLMIKLRHFAEDSESKKGILARLLIEKMNMGEYIFTRAELQQQCGLTTYEIHQTVRAYKDYGFIKSVKINGKTYFKLCFGQNLQTDQEMIPYSDEVLELINRLRISTRSPKDRRIGTMLQNCRKKGIVTPNDYKLLGEQSKMHNDMVFIMNP